MPMSMDSFAAIDFETADYGRDSACAVAVVVVRGGEIVDSLYRLIRPPRRSFVFTGLHGIAWDDVRDEEDFAGVWTAMEPAIRTVDFLVAHNAAFDRSVLRACCAAHAIAEPAFTFECTMKLARRAWNLFPTKLPDVCRHLGIPLKHHDAASDARAAALIALAAMRAGCRLAAPS